MAWWRRMVLFPVKKALVAVAARVKSRKDGKGILKLHDDVQTCEYHDVQVMWEILLKTKIETTTTTTTNSRKRPEEHWRVS